MNIPQEHYGKFSFIDVGNTTVILKYYYKDSFCYTRRFLTKYFNTNSLKPFLFHTQYLFFSSVVPDITTKLVLLAQELEIECYDILSTRTPLIKWTGHRKGSDIIAQLEGASYLYGSYLTVISMGTAITVSQIDENYYFQGGIIMSNYAMQLDALHHFTALLPKISHFKYQKNEHQLLNLNTKDAMTSGSFKLIYYGLKGIIHEIQQEFPKKRIIGTGGMSLYFRDLFDILEPDLLFFGLLNCYQNKIRI